MRQSIFPIRTGLLRSTPAPGARVDALSKSLPNLRFPGVRLPDPFTLAGNAEWTDYAVSADVRFLSAASATIMGRIDSSDVFKDGHARWPSGYVFRLKPDGAWELLTAQYKKPAVTLASGSSSIEPHKVAPSGVALSRLADRGASGWQVSGQGRRCNARTRHVRAGERVGPDPIRRPSRRALN